MASPEASYMATAIRSAPPHAGQAETDRLKAQIVLGNLRQQSKARDCLLHKPPKVKLHQPGCTGEAHPEGCAPLNQGAAPRGPRQFDYALIVQEHAIQDDVGKAFVWNQFNDLLPIRIATCPDHPNIARHLSR